jgi:hypothetical protein
MNFQISRIIFIPKIIFRFFSLEHAGELRIIILRKGRRVQKIDQTHIQRKGILCGRNLEYMKAIHFI